MTAAPTTTPPSDATRRPPPSPGAGAARGPIVGFGWLSLLAGVLVLVILVGIVVSMTARAWPVFSKEGLGYFTNDKFDQVNNVYGAKAYIYGTVVVSLIAIVFAVPLSIGIALVRHRGAPRSGSGGGS